MSVGGDFDRLSDNPKSEKSSAWLSENDLFDRTFEEIYKKNEKSQIDQPLHTDPVLKKHNLIFGIVPNHRHVDKMLYQQLISKSYLTNIQKLKLQKLETFLRSDKMTHRELLEMQERNRRRANLEQVNMKDEKILGTKIDPHDLHEHSVTATERNLQNHKYFDDLFKKRYQYNIRVNHTIKKKKRKEELKLMREKKKQKGLFASKPPETTDYLTMKENDQKNMWLIPESSCIIKFKKIFMFVLIFYTSILYPIELQEQKYKEIRKLYEESFITTDEFKSMYPSDEWPIP